MLLTILNYYLTKVYEIPNIILIYKRQATQEVYEKKFLKKFITSISNKKILLEIVHGFFNNFKEIFSLINKFSRQIVYFNNNNPCLKFVIIYNFEKIGKFDQITLKSLIDKYSSFVRFIILCKKPIFIINEIFSKFLTISVTKNFFLSNFKIFFKLKNFYYYKFIFSIPISTQKIKNLFNNFILFYFFISFQILKRFLTIFIRKNSFLSNEFYFFLLELFKLNKIQSFKTKSNITFSNTLILINFIKLTFLFSFKFKKKVNFMKKF